MSRIGKLPLEIPDNVQVGLDKGLLKIKGPKGELEQKMHPAVILDIKDKEIKLTVRNPELKDERAIWGLFRSLLKNMLDGVVKGFEKKLEINGVGYRAQVTGRKLNLNLGFSHPVEFDIPEGIDIKVEKNIIVVSGIDKQKVGEVAAEIRSLRKPEPYKGKGIKYVDEVIRRKAGKVVKSAGETTV